MPLLTGLSKPLKNVFQRFCYSREDFGRQHAHPLLEKYRHQICSFNDDIQGTASVALASLLTAIKMNHAELHQQRIVIFGGGSAGIGIANHFLGAMITAGITREKALPRDLHHRYPWPRPSGPAGSPSASKTLF